MLAKAGTDDLATLHQVFQSYFVTESGKQAGLRLIDANLERGEYLAAAEIGDQLLSTYPKANLQAERPGLLFRTSIAYALAGDADSKAKSAAAAAQLKSEFPQTLGTVRGKDLPLAEALPAELEAIGTEGASSAVAASPDSWPTFGGGPSRGVVSSAKANPGTRLYSVPLSRIGAPPSRPGAAPQPAELESRIGIMPVVDRGELYFQDGTSIYAVSLESGVPLPAWVKTYASTNGQFVLPKVAGSTRGQQQTLTLTERHVLAVMGQPDRVSLRDGVRPQEQGEARMVCLDRATGKELWTSAMSSIDLGGAGDGPPAPQPAVGPDGQLVPPAGGRRNDDEGNLRRLSLSGAPLVVGDTVLSIGRSVGSNQGEDCYVVSFDLNTGKFRWACYVASSGMPAPMYGMPMNTTDNTSHLAYSNGRVYVLTNLGAVAALDAYGGTIVWLNIYPLDMPQMNVRGMHMGMGDGRQGATPKIKPWQHNAPIVSGGKLFVLPNEGKHLLIYDAVTSKEVKRVRLDVITSWMSQLSDWRSGQVDRLKVLVGVIGDRMLLASDSEMVYFDWAKFNPDNFPGHDSEQLIWPYKSSFAGRPFLTNTAVYTASSERLYTVELSDGLPKASYPAYPREKWDDGEGPGNIVVSGDHVIVAGATNVDVYTDLALATAKLDAEVAAAPTDPELRLRYAEVMFVAGQGEQAIKRLDEAIELMGGAKSLRNGPERDRLFSDALTFAVKSAPDGRAGGAERTEQFFDRAALSAVAPQQQVQYRMARAKFATERKDAQAAVKLYQQVLASAATRAVTVLNEMETPPTPAQAADVAERAIAELVKPGGLGGPSAYEPFEKQAVEAVNAAKTDADEADKAAKLLDVALVYPNASVAQPAMIAAAEAYESASRPRDAVRVLRAMWFKYQTGPARLPILEGMARNYLAIPDRSRTDLATTAAARLAVAATQAGDATLQKDLKLSDGTVIAEAGVSFSEALEKVRKITSLAADKALPDFGIPIPKPNQKPHPKPFLPVGPQTTLPNATALVPPSRDFARPDRVVTWSPRQLSIFNAGAGVPKEPISRSAAFPGEAGPLPEGVIRSPEAPRGVSWTGDTALVWGASKVVALDAPSGKTLWTFDLATQPTLEVLRAGDDVAVAEDQPGNPGVNGRIIVNGRVVNGNNVIVRNGIVVNGQQADPAGGQNAVARGGPASPIPPVPGAGEQVADVRPVGDRVLVTSSTGRIACVDLATGTIPWQTRLADTTPDRLAATEDFTVVRVRDDSNVRLVALDTFSGKVIGRQSFPVTGGNQPASTPLNLALSADGKLVYTTPTQLRMRDLYEGWDKDEKVYPPQTGQNAPRLFEGATQPGQLVIAEGRILALSDNAATSGQQTGTKFVSVYSLETVQPISLVVDAGGKRQVNQMLTTGATDWNVTLRTVGSKLYCVGTRSIYAYDLDHPDAPWSGATDTMDVEPQEMKLRDAFIGTNHIVLLDQPEGAATPQFRLYAFGRYTPVAGVKKGESGKLDYIYPASDPAGVAPQWQACDGGFYYATADGQVRVLQGADKK